MRDDGAAGELDNVRADVEDVSAGAGDDEVIGNGADNALDGGAGNDRLDGGGGVDSFVGGAGADALFARDGLKESVDCGTESDGGEADTNDELIACEGLALSSDLIPDADGDGATKPGDCDDGNPAIRPGVIDVLDNGVDEDCSGADAVNLDRDGDALPAPDGLRRREPAHQPGRPRHPGQQGRRGLHGRAGAVPAARLVPVGHFEFPRAFSRVIAVTVRQVRKGSTLRMSCRGAGARSAAAHAQAQAHRDQEVIERPLGRAKLRPGTRFELRRDEARDRRRPSRGSRSLPGKHPRPARPVPAAGRQAPGAAAPVVGPAPPRGGARPTPGGWSAAGDRQGGTGERGSLRGAMLFPCPSTPS